MEDLKRGRFLKLWTGVRQTSHRLTLAVAVLVTALLQPVTANGQNADLAELSLEDLMNIEVSTIGKKQQRMSEIPAAVYVITQEEIRRSGATSLPDVLRLVPGVEVAQIDNSNWAISIRGFNFRSSNKLLVLIDGRALYYPTYSNVFWDVQSTLLEDIQRVEVIRGPGASLWGANAVNGVINIVTKHARSTGGGTVATTMGTSDHPNAAVRFGGKAGNRGHYRLFGTYSVRENLVRLHDGTALDGRPYLIRGGFRSDWTLGGTDSLTVEGDLFQGGSPQAVYRSVLLHSPVSTDSAVGTSGGSVLLRWKARQSSGSETILQAYFDRNHHGDILLRQFHDVLDFDFQHHLRGERNDFLWGAGFRNTHQGSQGTWEASLQPSGRNCVCSAPSCRTT